MRIDLHVHSSVSDGTDTPRELVVLAKEAALDVIALCDHDTFAGIDAAQDAGYAHGVEVLAGIEISCEHSGAPVHLLGYGCSRNHDALNEALARIRAGRSGRLGAMVARLSDLGMPLTEDDIIAQAGSAPAIGRPHVADAMIAKGYVADRNEAFTNWLADDKPGFVPRPQADLRRAIGLVLDAGGVAVIAHPWSRKSVEVLDEATLASLAGEHGLDGIEVAHPEQDLSAQKRLRAIAASLDLIQTGSSDYHGTGKTNNDLGCNLTSASSYRHIMRRIQARQGVIHE